MITESYRITGGNFERAGSASSSLKERLKKLGVEPQDMRRVMIIAYEAEMNVVIHARKGSMWVTLNDGQINIEVKDEGPGIIDIDKAMTIGYSTAPAAARELGFGAGMGLPYIKKNSDLFKIESTVRRGTRIKSTVYLKLQDLPEPACNSLHVNGELCCECLHCLRACPTKAIRVREGKPQILEHLCIDCAACIAVCKSGVLSVECPDDFIRPSEDTVLIVPASFLVQFGGRISPGRVLKALNELGFKDVRIMEDWANAVHEAVIKYAEEETNVKPVLSPLCPAVVNFIELRFPSLIENLAPFLFPVQAAQNEFKGQDALFVASCPGQHTALIPHGLSVDGLSSNVKVMSPSGLFKAVLKLTAANGDQSDDPDKLARQTGWESRNPKGILQASGAVHVANLLEKAENGILDDLPVLELFMCAQGCFGSPLMPEDPFVARHRWLHSGLKHNECAKAVRRKRPFQAREGFRLDTDMSSAIMKLSRIDELMRRLPGKDCALCGAPTCGALAEDIAIGRAKETACVYPGANEDKDKGK